jgi:transposase-like protein
VGKSEQRTLTGDETKPYTNKQRLQRLYLEDEKSVAEIASQFDCSETTIRVYIKGFGIGEHTGPLSFFTDPGDGYEYLRVDQHKIRFHRVLMRAEHGLDALDDESVVHHCTEVPWDNRPSQLRIFNSQGEHASHHASEPIADDQQTLDSYPATDEESALRPDRNNRQMSLTEFERPESAADD